MKLSAKPLLVAVALVVAVSLATVIPMSRASAQPTPSPSGKVYATTVFPSFGGQFKDCYEFGTAGTLVIASIGTGTWALSFIGPGHAFYEGTASNSAGTYTLDSHGITTIDGHILAHEADTLGSTFYVAGTENPNCYATLAPGKHGGHGDSSRRVRSRW